MKLRLDDQTGDVAETLHIEGGHSIITVSQEADEVMARCAALRAEQPAFAKPGTFRQVAEVPVALVAILAAKGMDIINDPCAMRKFLNDREFAAFRTTAGRV